MSNSGPALDFRTINLANLNVPPMVKKEKGNLSCTPMYLNPQTGQSSILCVQTPVCRIPFGLSSQASDDGTVRFSVNGSFDDYKTDPLMGDFYKFCSNIQDYVIHLASHNSKNWLGEETSVDFARRLMNKVENPAQSPLRFDLSLGFKSVPIVEVCLFVSLIILTKISNSFELSNPA